MQVAGIIVFVIVAGFTLWLVIDTVIHIVKKVKEKKAKKVVKVDESTDK